MSKSEFTSAERHRQNELLAQQRRKTFGIKMSRALMGLSQTMGSAESIARNQRLNSMIKEGRNFIRNEDIA